MHTSFLAKVKRATAIGSYGAVRRTRRANPPMPSAVAQAIADATLILGHVPRTLKRRA